MSLPVANYSFEPSDAQPSVADGESTTTIAGWATDSPSLVVRNPSSAEFAGADGNGALPAPADGSQAVYNTSTLDSANLIGSALSIPATWQDGTPIGNGAGGLQQGVTYTITVAIGRPLNASLASNVVVELDTPTIGEGMIHYGYSFGVPPSYHPATGDFEDFTCAFNFDNWFNSGGGFSVNAGDSITPTINIGPGSLRGQRAGKLSATCPSPRLWCCSAWAPSACSPTLGGTRRACPKSFRAVVAF